LQRPANDPGILLQQALRAGLLTVGLLGNRGTLKNPQKQVLQAGYGLLSGNKIHIAVVGKPSQEQLESLAAAASGDSTSSVHLLSLGEWIQTKTGFMPVACSSGEAELVLSSNVISCVVAGPGADPGILEISRQIGIPLVTSADEKGAEEVIALAQQFSGAAPQPAVQFDPELTGEGEVMTDFKELQKRIENSSNSRFALLGGWDSLQHPLGYLPVELAGALRGKNYHVSGWGDAAVWMIKDGCADRKNDLPVHIVDSRLGPLLALDALAAAGKLDGLGGICFTGIRDCRDVSIAVGLAALGCKVALANPIPVWGSSAVRNQVAEMLVAGGGQLTSFDHPAEAQEILDWFAA
jgi:hypothetical protein